MRSSGTSPRPIARLALAVGALGLALAGGELWARLSPPSDPMRLRDGFRDAERRPIDPAEGLNPEWFVRVDPSPRPRYSWAPGVRFFHCYEGERRPWQDDQGCVEVRYNPWGLRERDEITPLKPTGQFRIVCIGDSFTMGWGVPVEQAWVRVLEQRLRDVSSADVRTVNCGGSGARVVDEYAVGLEHRFGRFDPDVVVVALCMNDLLMANGNLFHRRPRADTGSALLDRLLDARGGRLDLDPDVDWTAQVLAQPADHPSYRAQGGQVTRDMHWAAGTPQRGLRQMAAWCEARGVPFVVVMWPLLQSLGEGEAYPFEGMHQRVAAFCAEEGMRFIDLRPVLTGRPAMDYAVAPYDLHPNPLAHRLAADHLAQALAVLLP